MASPKFDSIQDYVASQDETKATTLKAIIDFILAEFPELEAKMAWNVPHIHKGGQYIVGLAAYKKHLTFSPWSPAIMESFGSRLVPFVVFKNCFQLPVDWEVDKTLVKDLVKARLAELD